MAMFGGKAASVSAAKETPASWVTRGLAKGYGMFGLSPQEAWRRAQQLSTALQAVTPLGVADVAWQDTQNLMAGRKRDPLGVALAAIPGAPAAKKAVAKGGELAMDTASRMARATEQGFTIPVFHGTRAAEPFERFTTYGGPQAHDLHGVHVGSVDAANDRLAKYFKGVDLTRSNERPSVMPLLMRMENPYLGKGGKRPMTEAEFRALVRKNARANGMSEFQAKVEIKNELLRRGHDVIPYINSVEDKGGVSYLVLKPENLRSRFAAFDPAKKNVSNIMAGVGGFGLLGAGFMPRDEQPQTGKVY